jgi:hypothetical protein
MFNKLFGKKETTEQGGDLHMTTHLFNHALGIKARDIITGCEGIIVTRNDHISGCAHYGLAQPETEAGVIPPTEFFDEGRIEFVGKGVSDRVEDPDATFKYEAGLLAKDKITGFKGKIGVRGQTFNSADNYALIPDVDEKGKLQEAMFFDEGRLEILDEGITAKEVESSQRGPIFSRDTQQGLY